MASTESDADGFPWFLKVFIVLAVLAILFVVVVDVLHFAGSL